MNNAEKARLYLRYRDHSERKIAFIAAPYASTSKLGEAVNILAAQRLGRVAVKLNRVPIVPHSYGEAVYGADYAPGVRARVLEDTTTLCRFLAYHHHELWVLLREDGSMSEGCKAEVTAFTRAWRLAWDGEPAIITGTLKEFEAECAAILEWSHDS